jgi:tetratricopeptide (TPR) repeat protein
VVAERGGKLTRARDLFSAAVERVPGFAPATLHLAGVLTSMGRRRQAMSLLEPLLQTSDDPEVLGQLAGLLRAERRTEEADAYFLRAEVAYERLIAKMPEAFADHGARLYLTSPRAAHAARALVLARANLEARPTREAFTLAIDAAIAAQDPGYACKVADRLRTTEAFSVRARLSVARALQACGRTAEATTLISQAAGR